MNLYVNRPLLERLFHNDPRLRDVDFLNLFSRIERDDSPIWKTMMNEENKRLFRDAFGRGCRFVTSMLLDVGYVDLLQSIAKEGEESFWQAFLDFLQSSSSLRRVRLFSRSTRSYWNESSSVSLLQAVGANVHIRQIECAYVNFRHLGTALRDLLLAKKDSIEELTLEYCKEVKWDKQTRSIKTCVKKLRYLSTDEEDLKHVFAWILKQEELDGLDLHIKTHGQVEWKKCVSLVRDTKSIKSLRLALDAADRWSSPLPACVESLNENRTTTKLAIRGNLDCVTPNQWIELLKENQHLEVLDLSSCTLPARSFASIAEGLHSNRTLTEISMKNAVSSRYSDTDKSSCWIAWGSALDRNSHLRVLNLENCRLDDNGISLIAAQLGPDSSIRSLQLGCNSITSRGFDVLVSSLLSVCSLRELDLSTNEIDGTAANSLSRLLNHRTLTKLVLDDNNIGGLLSVAGVEKTLAQNNSLEELSLERNGLNAQDAMSIWTALGTNNSSLRTLNMSWNNIKSDDFDRTLYHVMRGNGSLRFLDLSGNPLSRAGLVELFDGLAENRSLTEILLKDVDFEEVDFLRFASAMESNSSLETAHLPSPAGIVSKAGTVDFFERLPRMKGLRRLLFGRDGVPPYSNDSGFKIDDAVANVFLDAMRRNTTLLRVDVSFESLNATTDAILFLLHLNLLGRNYLDSDNFDMFDRKLWSKLLERLAPDENLSCMFFMLRQKNCLHRLLLASAQE